MKLLKGAFIAACAVLLLGPLVALAVDLARSHDVGLGSFTAGDRARLTGLMFATLRLTAGAVGLAVSLGVLVAVGIQNARGFYRRILSAVFPIPLLLPPCVVAIAWTHIIGKRGFLTHGWTQLSGQPLPFSIYGEWGSACVLALCWFPLVTMPTLLGLRACAHSAGAAGRVYAGPFLRAWNIDVPLMLPYVGAGACAVAWLALGDFEVPSVFLRNAFPVEIYAALQVQPDRTRALLLCVPLLALAVIVLAIRAWIAGRQVATVDSEWRPDAHAAEDSPRGKRLWAALAGAILIVAIVLPLISLVHQTGSLAVLQAGLQTARREILHSFATAFAAAALTVALAIPYAKILANARGVKRASLALLALTPLMIPGTVHGLAWIGALSESEWGRALLGFPYLMAPVNAARFFPLGVFLVAAAFEGLDPQLALAARSLGAGPWRRLTEIYVPLLYPGFLAAFAVCFAFSLSELGASILLNPIGYSTLPVRLSSLLHFGKDDLLAGLCLVQVFLALLPYQIASVLLERRLEARLA